MSVLAHANHPEMFVAGVVVGILIAVAQMAMARAKK